MGYKETPGPNLKRVDEVLATELKDFGIKPTPVEKEAFKSGVQQVYVQAIVDELGNRFPNVELLDVSSIFDPKYIPTEESQLRPMAMTSLRLFSLGTEKMLIHRNVQMSGRVSRGCYTIPTQN